MDLYTAMQYLTMASCCALAVAVMMLFVDRPSPAKPDQWFGDARSLAGVGGVLATLCALPAFAVGVRLFGLAEVLTTLRTMGPVLMIAGGGWVGLMLLVLSSERLGQRRRDRLAAHRARAAAIEIGQAVIRHHSSGKVLWRMDAPTLEGADLLCARLQGTDLRGADLRGAALVGAKLTGAFYDTETRWPRGFDPRRHGAKWVSQGFKRSGPAKDEHEPERLNP